MRANDRAAALSSGQAEMIPLRLTGFRPSLPQGKHIKFIAEVDGTPYYCKGDLKGGRLRATEWFCTSLAAHLNIRVPDFAPIHNPENDEILFGSKEVWGSENGFAVKTFLTSQIDPIIGDPYPWLGAYLSRLYVLDLFFGNPDRQFVNFLLVDEAGGRKLLAFDFASGDLGLLGTANFLVAHTQTLFVGRQLRKLRAFDISSAHEIIDWIEGCSTSTIEAILASMPDEWMPIDERRMIGRLWTNGKVKNRLDALRRGIDNESLL